MSSDNSEEFTVDPNDLEVFDEVLDPNYEPSEEGNYLFKYLILNQPITYIKIKICNNYRGNTLCRISRFRY